jgi:hypothetical protein
VWDELVDLGVVFPDVLMATNMGYSYDGLHMSPLGTTNVASQVKSQTFRVGQYNGWFVGDASGLTNFPGITTNYAVPSGATLYITNGVIMKVQ